MIRNRGPEGQLMGGRKNAARAMLVLVLVLVTTSCETLRSALEIERPTASVESVRLTGITFSDVELTAEIAIENPNSIGISLSSFAYQVDVEGNQLLSGREGSGLSIAAGGASSVTLPVVLSYEEIGRVVQAARQEDELAYDVAVELSFELPILGEVTVPARRNGTFPVVRVPRVRVSSIDLESIGFTGADLILGVEVENPNGFAFDLSAFNYQLNVQEQVWVDGTIDRARTISPRGSQEFALAFSLSFTALGRAVRDLLLGDDEIRYDFEGAIAITPDLPLLRPTTIPVNLSGSLPLRR